MEKQNAIWWKLGAAALLAFGCVQCSRALELGRDLLDAVREDSKKPRAVGVGTTTWSVDGRKSYSYGQTRTSDESLPAFIDRTMNEAVVVERRLLLHDDAPAAPPPPLVEEKK